MRESDTKLSINDDFGDPHQYYIVLFPAGTGFKLACRLLRIVGGMLGRSWNAVSPMDIGDKVQEVAGVLDSGLDGDAIAKALEMLSAQILDEGGDAFLREILAQTHRDGHKVQQYFDAAYAGNYGELFEAVYQTCKVNFGPFFKARLGGWFSGLGALVSRAQMTLPIPTVSASKSD